jgi:hypothetical protein
MLHTTHSAPGRQRPAAAGPTRSHWHSIVAYRAARAHVAARAGAKPGDEVCDISSPDCDFPDPEAKFRRYGKLFGGGYKLSAEWLKDVPRVRVRRTEERAKDELLELAVLNERLAGNKQPWEARQRLEYIKMRRKNWEHVYDYVTKTDAAATLALIEEANEKVGARGRRGAPDRRRPGAPQRQSLLDWGARARGRSPAWAGSSSCSSPPAGRGRAGRALCALASSRPPPP